MTSLSEQVWSSEGVDCSISTSSSAASADKRTVTSVNRVPDSLETCGATSDLFNQREARLHEDGLTHKLP